MKATTEKAFEGSGDSSKKGLGGGFKYRPGQEAGFFPEYIISFIKDTQADLWGQMEKLHGGELHVKLIETLTKKQAGASAVLLMSFIVVLCGNTSFIWIDWTRYHMPIYPLYALMIGSGIYGMAMCLRRCFGPGFHFRNSGPSPPPFCQA